MSLVTILEEKGIVWDKYDSPIELVCINSMSAEDTLNFWNIFMNRRDLLLSVTNSYDEITIFYDSKLGSGLFPNAKYCEIYIAYRAINTGSLMEVAGLVKHMSTLFSNQNIPIMYLTTYNNDYVLVPVEYEQQADKLTGILENSPKNYKTKFI